MGTTDRLDILLIWSFYLDSGPQKYTLSASTPKGELPFLTNQVTVSELGACMA